MSFLDGSSFSASFSFLGLDFGALDNDPYRSRNTVASAQSAYRHGFYSQSTEVQDLGSGAVFQVTLRQSKRTGELYAVKTAHASDPTKKRGGPSHTGVFAVLREIQVVSHAIAATHPNILDVIGWDWGQQRMPVVFVEYAKLGTLKDWLPKLGPLLKSHEKRKLCLDIACGLNALHSIDIAHGDIKLANTLVFADSKAGYMAKLSDFSHAIFGLSTRRRSAYPGSRLYNAPEIRKLDSVVLFDRLPRCETYSFGLLVWEILKNGSHFFERAWIRDLSTSWPSGDISQDSGFDSQESDGNIHIVRSSIDSLGTDGILYKAQSFSGISGIVIHDQETFHHVFAITLKDRADMRRDMQTVAVALDTYDEGRILHYSHRLAVRSYAVWEFNPLSTVPWKEQLDFFSEVCTELAQPVQPSHAELHFILSRCYAKGYGVHRSPQLAITHLYHSASLDNIEATCLIEIGIEFFGEFPVQTLPKLAQNDISKSLRNIRTEVLRGTEEVSLAAYMRVWNKANGRFAKSRQFFWNDGKKDRAYDWIGLSIEKLKHDVAQSGERMCDITITYASLASPFNSGTFYEACASFGIQELFDITEQTKDEEYTQSSWGDHHEVWSRLLIAAAKAGEVSMLKRLISFGLETPKKMWKSPSGESPLHYLPFFPMSSNEKSKLVNQLLDLGMDINGAATTRIWIPPFSIELSGTPLHMAVLSGCNEAVHILIHNGANPFEAFGDIGTPFQLAARLHLHDIVRICIRQSNVKPHHLDQALQGIGLPTKRGWFVCSLHQRTPPNKAWRVLSMIRLKQAQ